MKEQETTQRERVPCDDGELFCLVGAHPFPESETSSLSAGRKKQKLPLVSLAVLLAIILGCLLAGLIAARDPSYLDLANYSHAPDREFLFGTDTLGRDIFSCIWYGGRISLGIGFFSTAISTAIAFFYGAVSGMAPAWLDAVLMRLTEIFLSVPSLLTVIFLQAILGEANVLSISLVIGITGWFGIAKIIRTEVRQMRSSGYVIASKCMGGGFFHILRRHLIPNFVPSVMFMIVMNVRSAIVAESTLSFMGMGLPLETVSWGSMLSLAQNALMIRAWWMILIPGGFLVALIMSLTSLGNWLHKNMGGV